MIRGPREERSIMVFRCFSSPHSLEVYGCTNIGFSHWAEYSCSNNQNDSAQETGQPLVLLERIRAGLRAGRGTASFAPPPQGDFAKSATCAKRARQIFNEARQISSCCELAFQDSVKGSPKRTVKLFS